MIPALCMAACLAGCQRPGPPVRPQPRYTLERPYQAGGIWWYPRESYNAEQTGLATVLPRAHAPLTSDGEAYDANAMAAAHPTLQLPAIARVTNLENGLSAVVRVNDRGSPTPHRLIQLTSRAGELLGIPPGGVAQIRMTVLPAESHGAADELPGAPVAAIDPAPRGAVRATDLPPPAGARAGGGHALLARVAAAEVPASAPPPARLPESVTRYPPSPGRLWVRLDTFQSYQYANAKRAKLARLAPSVVPVSDGRARAWRVMLGPFGNVADADRALDAAIAAGVLDALIVVQ